MPKGRRFLFRPREPAGSLFLNVVGTETHMLELPGLIDPHVHLREPGATHKEDFASGTMAALAGGFTTVLAMPNTQPPITDRATLAEAKALAKRKAYCDYGIFLGAGRDNLLTATDLVDQVCGMKMYLDQTYGPLRVDSLEIVQGHVAKWSSAKPIAVHAEGRSLAASLLMAAIFDARIHVCHVSRKVEILLIKKAKERGIPVTCEVTPHHLFLTAGDIQRLGQGRSEVRPRLASREDQDALWENMEVIDCIASDHAPHTLEEKDSDQPPPGFPGLETSLALMFSAVDQGRMSLDDLVLRMYHNPARIFAVPSQGDTGVEFDEQVHWEVSGNNFLSRCGWSPFEGMMLPGKVRRVKIRGEIVFEDGEVRTNPGFGEDITQSGSPL
jgi:carbamoyl-phosphate synthase/aspartate carbamoyltransferase/dihydroorotase